MLCGWYLIKFCPGQYPMQPHWPLCNKINICWVDLTGITGALLGWKSHHYSIPFTAGSTLSSSGTRFTNRAAFPFMSSDRRWKRWQSSRCSSSPPAQELHQAFSPVQQQPCASRRGCQRQLGWTWCMMHRFMHLSHCSHIAQCVHCTVGFPCSKKSPVVATGECSWYGGITIANRE